MKISINRREIIIRTIEIILMFVAFLFLISKVFKEPMDSGRGLILFILIVLGNTLNNLAYSNEFIVKSVFLRSTVSFLTGVGMYLLYELIVSRLF
ncbi:MAG: hypothetical protein CBR30_05305 [Dictyoglomus sp. NZ13-RE01]|nr:MAG: hypothetical protein CBR30_05305 [Dictyoglomus sp. NZ13-RE01]